MMGWLRLLTEGQCETFGSAFAEKGRFFFRQGHLKALTTRAEVTHICLELSLKVKAMRLIFNFQDRERHSFLVLIEEFVLTKPNKPLARTRAAIFGTLSADKLVDDFHYVLEDQIGEQDDFIKTIVSAQVRVHTDWDCSGWRPLASHQLDLTVQDFPDSSSRHGIGHAIESCQQAIDDNRQRFNFSNGELDGVFSSPKERMVILFFRVELLEAASLTFRDEPRATIVWLQDGKQGTTASRIYDWWLEGKSAANAWYQDRHRSRQHLEARAISILEVAKNASMSGGSTSRSR